MKKVLLIGAMLLVFALPALAGPYFSLENDGLDINPVLVLGADFSVALAQSGARVFGDGNFTLPDNDLGASIGIGFAGVQAEMEVLLDFNSNYKLLEWDTAFTLTGYPFTGIKVWGGISFNFIPATPDWALVPVFGIEGRW